MNLTQEMVMEMFRAEARRGEQGYSETERWLARWDRLAARAISVVLCMMLVISIVALVGCALCLALR